MIESRSLCKYSEVLNKVNEYPIYKIGIEWLSNFIGKPHPNLGRPGAVCPFVPSSIKKNFITLGVIRTIKNTKEEAIEKLTPLVDFFYKLEPTAGANVALKCLVIFFPDIDPVNAQDFIDEGHRTLKKHYVSNGLMIGEFHPSSLVPGYYNKNFYPMASPVPAFAVRYMSAHDIQFLNRPVDSVEMRLFYIQHYLKFVGNKLAANQLAQTKRLLNELQNENKVCVYD